MMLIEEIKQKLIDIGAYEAKLFETAYTSMDSIHGILSIKAKITNKKISIFEIMSSTSEDLTHKLDELDKIQLNLDRMLSSYAKDVELTNSSIKALADFKRRSDISINNTVQPNLPKIDMSFGSD